MLEIFILFLLIYAMIPVPDHRQKMSKEKLLNYLQKKKIK